MFILPQKNKNKGLFIKGVKMEKNIYVGKIVIGNSLSKVEESGNSLGFKKKKWKFIWV